MCVSSRQRRGKESGRREEGEGVKRREEGGERV
jgi:hypothetical protein